ncbi:MAG: 50S ribosomal protein L11 methyltransferase [Bryobacteraceae bacterium]
MPFWVRVPGGDDETVAAMAEFATTGIEEAGESVTAWFASAEEAARCAAGFASREVESGEVARANWNEAWQREWQPMEVGRRWYLAPPWDPAPAPGGRIRLAMHAGNAFGNGDHPATHLCMVAMEERLPPGGRFLDVGCGSGLLCEAAGLLGAAVAGGCDLDADAVGGAGGLGLVWIGSVHAAASQSFDFVVANLPAPVTVSLLGEIARVLPPGGWLVASGLLEDQVEAVRAAAAGAGFTVVETRTAGEWRALVLRAVRAA